MQEKFSCALRSQPPTPTPMKFPSLGWELLDLSPYSSDEFLDGGYIAVAFSDLKNLNMLIAGTQGP